MPLALLVTALTCVLAVVILVARPGPGGARDYDLRASWALLLLAPLVFGSAALSSLIVASGLLQSELEDMPAWMLWLTSSIAVSAGVLPVVLATWLAALSWQHRHRAWAVLAAVVTAGAVAAVMVALGSWWAAGIALVLLLGVDVAVARPWHHDATAPTDVSDPPVTVG